MQISMKTISKSGFRWGLLGIFFWLSLTFQTAWAQTLYEVTFQAARVTYKGFLVYFNEEDAYMRVGYTYQGTYHVVDVKYKSSSYQEDGTNFFVMIGSNPTYITSASRGMTYNPDHFFWFWEGDYNNQLPYVTDDPDFNENNVIQTKSYREVDAKELTPTYLRQFFRTDERQYKALLRMNSENNATLAQNNSSQNNNNSSQNTNQNSSNSSNNSNSSNTQKAKMHLVLVVNTDIADIGQSCKVDGTIMETEFREIAKAIGISFQKYTISGQNFTRSKVESTLQGIQVGRNDIIVFYYSGHGFRWSNQTDRYPQFDMRSSDYTRLTEQTALPFSSIDQFFATKGARLTLLLADCCNSDVGRNQYTSTTFMASRSYQGAEISKLKKLFLEARGKLIMSGSAPGEYAWCNVNGGFFTLSFMQALKEEIGYMRGENPNWYNIVKNTQNNTKYKINSCATCKPQNPIAEVKISN